MIIIRKQGRELCISLNFVRKRISNNQEETRSRHLVDGPGTICFVLRPIENSASDMCIQHTGHLHRSSAIPQIKCLKFIMVHGPPVC